MPLLGAPKTANPVSRSVSETWKRLKKAESPKRAIFSYALKIVPGSLFSAPKKKLSENLKPTIVARLRAGPSLRPHETRLA
jgi:hypothetical protein